MGKVMKGMAVGAMVGAAIGIMAFPQLDRRTQRQINRTRKRVMGMAEDAYGNMVHYIK